MVLEGTKLDPTSASAQTGSSSRHAPTPGPRLSAQLLRQAFLEPLNLKHAAIACYRTTPFHLSLLSCLVHVFIHSRDTQHGAVTCQAGRALKTSEASSLQTADRHARTQISKHCPECGTYARSVASFTPDRSAPRGREGLPRRWCRWRWPLGMCSGATH